MQERFKANNVDRLKKITAISALAGVVAAGCAIEPDSTQDVSPEPSERNYMSEPMQQGWLRGASDNTISGQTHGAQDHSPIEGRSFISNPLRDNWLIGSGSE